MSLPKVLAHTGGVCAAVLLLARSALAQDTVGRAVDWQLGFQAAGSPVMAEMMKFHDMLLVVITLISLFVLGLLVYVILRFNKKANPQPTRTTHSTGLEVAWTVVPIIILVLIAIPSFKLLYQQAVVPEADMTIKAIGYQWYWTYEYPDDGITFDSFPLDEESATPERPYLLATDTDIVVPVGKVVRVLVTANDVLHSWAVPSLGVKMDAVPGRVNETWFLVDEPGLYFGQCSELCGVQHAFMPIAVKAVSQQDYDAWLETAREAHAPRDEGVRLAAARR